MEKHRYYLGIKRNRRQNRNPHDPCRTGTWAGMDCNKGWDFYLKESLFNFLENKAGLPGSGIRATITVSGKTYPGILFSKDQPAPRGSGGAILIDVKETAVEHVVSTYAAHILNDDFNPGSIKGNYYMLLQNPGGTFLKDVNNKN